MSFLTLEIARNTMTANRVAMDVAAQNVANANTPGYVRQRAVLAPLVNACTGDPTLPGRGVTVAQVQRLRNQCLETQVAHQEGQLGRAQAVRSGVQRVENAFRDLDDKGVASALETMFGSLQTLQTTPDSRTAREAVLWNAETLCDQLHAVDSQLQAEQQTLEQDLGETVDQVNQLLRQVGELNAQITAAGDSLSANDLRVTREQALRQLAGLCGAVGLDQPDGAQDVLLGGVRLVQGAEVKALSLVADPARPGQHQVAVGTLTDLDGLGGRVAGDLEARDTQLAAWHDSLNEFARTLADAVNTAHRQGYDLAGNAGGDFFTYDAANAAATLTVSSPLAGNPDLLAAAGAPGAAAGDGTNAAALAALAEADLCSGGTQTLGESYGDLLYRVGAAGQRAEEAVTARETLLESLDTQYSDEAGVSLDEEAVDIMRYQQAYNAGARLVQTALEMLDTLFAITR